MSVRAIPLLFVLAFACLNSADCATPDSINIGDYTMMNNPTDNATAFSNAFAAAAAGHQSVYCPDGASYNVGTITVPSTIRHFHGYCNLVATSSTTVNSAVLVISNNTQGVVVENVNISGLQAAATYSGNVTSGSSNIPISSTSGLTPGMIVTGPGIATGAYIATIPMAPPTAINISTAATGGSGGTVSLTFYYNADAIQITNSSNVTIRNTILNGRYGIYAYPGTGGTNSNMRYVGNTINAYALRGIESFSNATDQFFTISDNLVFGGITGSVIGIAADGGTGYTISGNRVYGANVFGIEISGVTNQTQQFAVTGNTTMYTKHEGINVQGASYGTVCNNTLNFGSDSVDGALSIFADTGQVVADVVICNNQIYSPGAFGIDISSYPTVAMSAAGTVTRLSVTGNQITNPYSNLPDETFGACIDLLAEGTTFVMVADNNCVITSTASLSRTKYIVAEFLGRTTSTPDYNRLGFNPGKGTIGSQRVLGASSIITNPSLLPITTFGSLPTCGTSLQGTIRIISDASNPPCNAAVTSGGGSTITPLLCNGTNWVAH